MSTIPLTPCDVKDGAANFTDGLAAELGRRLIERRDVKAVQKVDGSYRPDRSKFTMTDLRQHLSGERTFGHYLVSPEGNCRVFCFDIDLVKPSLKTDPPFQPTWRDEMGIDHEYNPRELWATTDPRNQWHEDDHPQLLNLRVALRCLAEGLAHTIKRLHPGITVAVSYSGNKGLHVYGFTGSVPAADAREAAMLVLDAYGCFEPQRGNNFFRHRESVGFQHLEIEVYPKQDEVDGEGLGNLLRLPLGVNRKSGNAGYFLDLNRGYSPFAEDDPIAALTQGSLR